ncbi:MAG: Gfo/Idh/MocA family oxidoreductase [Hyphomicrobiales bacterium]|nr:Gfo/Idh/MocA family oxidoreductase [Hyphomicrobiales bacterium]
MTTPLRYGIIGAGMMAREHVRNLGLVPGSRVTAIADPDARSRDTAAAEVSRVLGDEPALTAEAGALIGRDDVDAVLIASPNDTHTAILSEIFRRRPTLPVLCEKPICTRADELAPLARAAAAHKAPVWVAMEYRYMPPVAELVKSVRAGDVGRLRMLSIREHRFPFLPKVGDWNRFNERTGGTLVEKCCHFFDLMRLIAQSEPVRVYASGAADVNHKDERYAGRVPDIIDNAFVIVDFANGVRAALDLCMFAEGAYFQEEIAATGDTARVEAFVPGVTRFWQGGGREREAEIEVSPRAPQNPTRRKVHVDEAILKAGDHHGSTFFQHQRFRAAVLERTPVEVTVEDGLKAVAIGIAGERSIAERRAVSIDGFMIR